MREPDKLRRCVRDVRRSSKIVNQLKMPLYARLNYDGAYWRAFYATTFYQVESVPISALCAAMLNATDVYPLSRLESHGRYLDTSWG